jgi:hypothetical protein
MPPMQTARNHSARNAVVGSTPAARRAGAHAANPAISTTNAMTPLYVTASTRVTPNNIV